MISLYAHPGVRVLKYARPIHSIPLWSNQPRTFTSHSIQAQGYLPHSVRVSVRVGWSASGATAEKKKQCVLRTWYEVFWYSSINSIKNNRFHRRCISNSRTLVRIPVVLQLYHGLSYDTSKYYITRYHILRDTYEVSFRYIYHIYIHTYIYLAPWYVG